ncbi:MAG: type II secretion system protein [Planctomycetes bacterium]|nr:type II secretion system protein [Planctomycetota bacterium]
MNTRTKPNRGGFTLVEMLVVVAIIGILAAILVPTLYGVVIRGRENRIAQELNQLHMQVEAYKQKFGDYPPDFVDMRIVERHLRKAFPRHQENLQAFFTARGVPDPSEALVFWLGSLKNDPRKPLTGSGEVNKLFDFKEEQLRDLDGDGWLSYVPKDAPEAPYVYFDSRSYNAGYPGLPDPSNPSPATLSSAPLCRYVASNPNDVVYPYQIERPNRGPDAHFGPVQSQFPPPPNPVSPLYNREWVNPTTYQIISAGLDGEFGPDPYNPDPTTGQLKHKVFPAPETAYPVADYNWGEADWDNIANFSDGRTFEDHVE